MSSLIFRIYVIWHVIWHVPWYPIVSGWIVTIQANPENSCSHTGSYVWGWFPFSISHHSRDITRWGHYNLVGGFNPSEKYESQLRSPFPYIMENIKKKESKPPTTYSMLMYVMVPLDIAIPSISYGLRPSPNLVVKNNFSPWPMGKIGYGCTNMSHKHNSIVNNPDVFHDIPTCVTCKFWFWSILICYPCNMLQDEPSPVISWFINSLAILISSRIPTKLCASTWLSSWPHQNYPVQKISIRPQWPFHWIGLRENLQETPIFNGKYHGFL